MCDRYEDIRAKGADVVMIGMGSADKALRFRERRGIPFRLLVDNDKISYRAAGLRRGKLGDVIGPRVWGPGARSLLKGRGIATPREDPGQLGGTLVVLPEGTIVYRHRARDSGDNAPTDEVLRAIP